jgi:hypothetical protein
MFDLRKLVAAGLFAAPIGCSISINSGPSWGGGCTGSCSSRLDGDVNYRVAHLTNNGTPFLVLVVDGAGGITGQHSGPQPGGEIGTLDGPTITWECETEDAKTGTVTIGATKYELQKGGLFLVTARHGKVWVRQSPADLSGVKGEVDLAAIRTAVGHDAIAAEFLDRVEKPRPTVRDAVMPTGGKAEKRFPDVAEW